MPQAGPTTAVTLANEVAIAHISIPLADTEIAFTIPDNLLAFELQAQVPANLKISFVMGQSGTNYFTVPPGGHWAKDNLSFTGKTLYIQSSKGSQVIEFLSWVRV